VGIYNGSLKIKVTVAPEKGKANKVVIEALASYFNIKKSQVQIVSGEISRNKVFRLDIPLEEVKRKIHDANSRLVV
jgi:uncharacterized protein (TIGR00251 family)